MRWRVSDLGSGWGVGVAVAWRRGGGGGGFGVGGRAEVRLVADHGLELTDGVLFCLEGVGPGLVVGDLRHESRLWGVFVLSILLCTLPGICAHTYLTTGK